MDLRPYTCVLADCSFTKEPFATRQLWTNHLELEHRFGPDWNAIQCPLCFETTKSGEHDVTAHLARHLVDIASASLPRDVESDAESESDASSKRPGTHSSIDHSEDLKEPGTSVAQDLQTPYSNEHFTDVQQEPQESSDNETSNGDSIVKHTLPPMARESKAGGAEYSPSPPSTSASTSQHLVSDVIDDKSAKKIARHLKSHKPGDVVHLCRDCKKEFKRPCDLTKHEKTHERPWKCKEEKCKYFEFGWPTEKERDRHVHDKHATTPAQYKCLFPPCTYASKRESNNKQHMERAHGWHYVRSKSNGRKKDQAIAESSRLITPSPEDLDPYGFGTPSINVVGFASDMRRDGSTGLPHLTTAFSVDGNTDKVPVLPQMTRPGSASFVPQYQVDEGFGDAIDTLDMQTFSRPTEEFTLFDNDNASTNNTADFFPDFNRLGRQFDGRTQLYDNRLFPEFTLDNILGHIADAQPHRNLRADAENGRRLSHSEPDEAWTPYTQGYGRFETFEEQTPSVLVAEDPVPKVDGVNKQLPEHPNTWPEASTSKEKQSDLACNICGKLFTKISHRKNHELSHRGGRPFDCSDCGKTFSRQDTLDRHQKVHRRAERAQG